MLIGILGGSFDPVHNAHIKMAETALKEFKLDKIIFVPAFIPPHKKILVASEQDRYNMLFEVTKDIEQYEIDTYELDSKKSVYSYEMLDYIKSNHNSDDIKMIIGADSFNNLALWKNTDYIVKKYGFIVFPRPNIEINTNSPYYKDCLFSKYVMKNIASTDIRQKLKEKKDISKYVPKQVFDYIRGKNLYNE